jgi:CheY-like chemotaxis protein
MMPGMDGPATLRALRERKVMENVPAIFLTAKAQRQEVESYIALGSIGVITKPFDPMTLPDTIRRLWHEQERKATGTAG